MSYVDDLNKNAKFHLELWDGKRPHVHVTFDKLWFWFRSFFYDFSYPVFIEFILRLNRRFSSKCALRRRFAQEYGFWYSNDASHATPQVVSYCIKTLEKKLPSRQFLFKTENSSTFWIGNIRQKVRAEKPNETSFPIFGTGSYGDRKRTSPF